MPMTAAWRKKVGDHLLGKTDIGALGDLWMGIATSDPGASGSYAGEVVGTGYARINVTSLFGAFDATTGIATNTSVVNFGVPGSNWGTSAYVFFADSVSGTGAGTMKYKEAVPNPRSMESGSHAVKWNAGKITITHV